jgi:hypothetical protein
MNAGSPLESVLSRLEAVRERQNGQWSARCPAHADDGPSLSVRLGNNGGVLLHCFAGCEVHEIVAALDLQLHDLFPPRERPDGAPRRTPSLLTDEQALELAVDELNFGAITAASVGHGAVLKPADVKRLLECAGRLTMLQQYTKRRLNAS